MGQDLLGRYTSAIDRCQRQNLLTLLKLLLSSLAIIGHCGKHFNKILQRCPKFHLPDHSSIVALGNTFTSLFINKISVIHSSFHSDSHLCGLNPADTRKVLQNPTRVTTDEVRCLVLLAPCKSSDLDPIPTSSVKDCIDILTILITSIVNLSVSEGSLPSHYKPLSPLYIRKPLSIGIS